MAKCCYMLSVLFVGITFPSINAPVQAKIDTSELEAAIKREQGRKTPTEIQREAQQGARRRDAQKANHNYAQATSLAVTAIDACYSTKNLEQCNKANEIKNTLMNWCIQSNNIKSNACDAHRFILNYENAAQAVQTPEQIGY